MGYKLRQVVEMSNITRAFMLSPQILLLDKGPDTNCYDNSGQ